MFCGSTLSPCRHLVVFFNFFPGAQSKTNHHATAKLPPSFPKRVRHERRISKEIYYSPKFGILKQLISRDLVVTSCKTQKSNGFYSSSDNLLGAPASKGQSNSLFSPKTQTYKIQCTIVNAARTCFYVAIYYTH